MVSSKRPATRASLQISRSPPAERRANMMDQLTTNDGNNRNDGAGTLARQLRATDGWFDSVAASELIVDRDDSCATITAVALMQPAAFFKCINRRGRHQAIQSRFSLILSKLVEERPMKSNGGSGAATSSEAV